MMARITFNTMFKSAEMQRAEIPVEVRRGNFALVGRALSSGSVELKPGEYFVSATLPGGQEIVQPLTVGEKDVSINLAPDPKDASPHEWEELRHFLNGPVRGAMEQIAADVMAASDAASPCRRVYLRVFAGNPVTGSPAVAPVDAGPVLRAYPPDHGRFVQFAVDPSPRMLIAQLLQPGLPPLNRCVAGPSLLAVSCQRDGVYKLEVYPGNESAALLVRYRRRGAVDDARATSYSSRVQAERLLKDKEADPVSAAIGAYAILRFGELERLHEWTRNLCEWFPWLPDGAAIHAEHLARRGHHGDALNVFAELPRRGLPLLTDGFFYAIDRLRLYCDQEIGGRLDAGKARGALEALAPYSSHVDSQLQIVGYPGLDPARPADELTPLDLSTPPGALDLTDQLAAAAESQQSRQAP
jgi:hypothetical protein